MNAQELFIQGTLTAGIWYCEKCRNVAKTKAAANECCTRKICACGNPVKPYWTTCDKCQRQEIEARELKRFESAEKLTPQQWDGPIVTKADNYHESVGDFLDEFECGFDDKECELPDYVWTCDEDPFVVVGIEAIDSAIEGDMPDDFDLDRLDGREELAAAIATYCERNKKAVSWTPNYKRCVLLPKSE